MINQTNGSRLFKTFLLTAIAAALYLQLPRDADRASADTRIVGCAEPIQIRDYLAHVKSAAPVHGPPESGVLPFAPRGISLQRLSHGPQVGRGLVGFAFRDEAINYPRRLNWIIKATLSKISANGNVLKVVSRKTERIGIRKVDYDTVTGQRFTVPGDPAYYRIDLNFADVQGRNLGNYSEYVRVMKAKFQVAMTLSDSKVMPGSLIQARIENRGTEPVLAELNVVIEQHNGTEWIEIAPIYRNGKVVYGRAYVWGGETGPCFTYKVPSDLSSGHFRVTEGIRRSLRQKQQLQASAHFEVGLPR
jgi:hypothetical protein